MSYQVHLSRRCQKFLAKMEVRDKDRIIDKLKKLSENPHPSDSKFITRQEGDKVFRIRIGYFRALYIVIESREIVLVTKIDKRPRIYNR